MEGDATASGPPAYPAVWGAQAAAFWGAWVRSYGIGKPG